MKRKTSIRLKTPLFSIQLIAVLFGTTIARGSEVSEVFTATVTGIANPGQLTNSLYSIFPTGAVLSGTFSYNTNMPALNMTPYCGTQTCSTYQLYGDGVPGDESISSQLRSENLSASQSANGEISAQISQYNINFFGLSAPTEGSLVPSYVAFTIFSNAPVTQLAWPTTGFDLVAYNNAVLQFAYLSPSQGYIYADATITELTPLPVPLPASAWLLVSAMGGLGFSIRRRR